VANFDSEAAPLDPALNALQAVIAEQSVDAAKAVLVRPEGGGAP